MPASLNHPCFEQPTNSDSLIWRYMDFTKFVSLLENKALFFCQADCFEDIFEGSVPKGNLVYRQHIHSEIPETQRQAIISELVEHRKTMRSYTNINCWHMSDHESAAMWKLYAATNEAVAICSRYSSLVDVLDSNVYVGKVNYIDFETSIIPEHNSFWPFMFKRMSFAHEKEIRAVIQDLAQISQPCGGQLIPIETDVLIQTVYVAPNAPNWYFDLVKQVVNRYGLSAKVIRSSLSELPVY